MARYTATERIGVNAVEKLVIDDLGWIFREQTILDMGIDAHLELVEEGNPSGKLVAVQIKTGPGNFHLGEDHLTYYIEKAHHDYWLNHALPVILVAHLPDTNETLWIQVCKDNVVETATRWKVEIPRGNHFGRSAKPRLTAIFEGTESQQRFRRLVLDEPLMRHIESGGKVSLELEHWVNKSLGRSPVTVLVSRDGEEPHIEQDYYVTYTGYDTLGFAQSIFPWASISIDEEFYELNADSEEYGDFSWGHEEDDYYSAAEVNAIYPYSNSAGEVDHYRFELSLNRIAKAYLTLASYLSDES